MFINNFVTYQISGSCTDYKTDYRKWNSCRDSCSSCGNSYTSTDHTSDSCQCES